MDISAGVAALSFFGFLAAACIAGTWQERKKAELAHFERRRRLEMGLIDPARDHTASKALVCVAMGAGVPLAAFATTLIAYLNRSSVPDEIWIAPGIVSVVCVIVTGILAGRIFGKPSDRGSQASPSVLAKYESDPDAFDVVGRRG